MILKQFIKEIRFSALKFWGEQPSLTEGRIAAASFD